MEQNRSLGKKIIDLFAWLLFGVVLLIGGMYIPLLGIVSVFLWTLPIAFAVYRDGIGGGIFLCLVLGFLGFLIMGIPDCVVAVGSMTVLALFYGISLRKKMSPGKTLCVGVFIGIALGMLYVLCAFMQGSAMPGDFRTLLETELTEVYRVYVESGLLDAALTEGLSVDAYVADLVEQMVQVLPSFLFIAVIGIAAVNYIVAQYILKRRSADVRPLPIFRDWHLPWWVLWGVVVALMFYVGGNFFDSEILLIIAKNILLCYMPILVVAGISLVRYFFVAFHAPRGVQVLLWIVAALFVSVSMMFFVLMGAADAAVDYRSGFMKKKNNDIGGRIK